MNRKLLLLLTALVTMAQGVWAWSGSGTQANPYLITSASDWNTLATNSASNTYTDAYFKLTADITVTTMVGTESHKFGGIFDGGGHTLTLSYGTSGSPLNSNNAAPFSYVNGVTIKNLHVAGNIYTSGQFAGSLMGDVRENNAIRNCWSSVVLTTSKSGDGTHGGFAGVIRGGTTNFTNCLFDGKLLGGGTNGCGGFVGFTRTNDGARLNFTDCLYKPSGQTIDTSNGATFSRAHNTSLLGFTNCWYTQTISETQGSNASGMSNNTLLSNLGSGWEIKDSKVVPKMIPATFSGSGTAASPYLITSTADWNNLASNVNDLGETYSGKYFELTNDITVTTMVGYPYRDGSSSDHNVFIPESSKPFCGIFDGYGHTLTVNYYSDDGNVKNSDMAPFRLVGGVTIRNLHTTGTITTASKFASGLIGRMTNNMNFNVTIENCVSGVTIISTISGDGTHGGFVAVTGHQDGTTKTLNIRGCLFNGTINGSNTRECGGFVGWNERTCTTYITNCMFNPVDVTVNTYGCCTFARYRDAVKVNITNSYYFRTLNEAQGKAARTITVADNTALVKSGSVATYSVSGITAYSTGIEYNDVYYVGNGDEVTVSYTGDEKLKSLKYNGTEASGSGNSRSFSMPDANVTITTDLWYRLKENGETTEGNKSQTSVFLERTLSASNWSTFSAPFSAAKPDGWTLMELSSSDYTPATQTLTLNFSEASSIVAGTPYLVKATANAENPTFEITGTQDWTANNPKVTDKATFVPVLIPTNLAANDKTVLYLSTNNTLYYPSKVVTVNGFRAYFQLNGLTAGDLPNDARAFVLNFGDSETTNIHLMDNGQLIMDNSVYDLQGRRVERSTLNVQRSTLKKGVYIKNGRKVVIK